eukprot:COSAG02_NODE_54974_length_293_cov_0.773196_1_plen_87_part_10
MQQDLEVPLGYHCFGALPVAKQTLRKALPRSFSRAVLETSEYAQNKKEQMILLRMPPSRTHTHRHTHTHTISLSLSLLWLRHPVAFP